MSRKAKQIADAVAAATSRRGFLGRLTRLAGTAAAGAAGMLAAATAHAKAGGGSNTGKPRTFCCGYARDWLDEGFTLCKRGKGGNPCPVSIEKRGVTYWLHGSLEVSHCHECADWWGQAAGEPQRPTEC